ncbi:MAG TPA: CBS domain-containing protein [Gammaproteobacteria bacterium]|nr:CBS domain-containing protein [Gammaproteobacteria bacterium]
MPIGELCSRDVVFVTRAESVVEAARLMRQHHVGDVVVIDEKNGLRTPVGVVTDRDIVIEVIAKGVSADTVTVGDIMSADAATVRETEGVYETIQYMRAKGVRRMPVVNAKGALVGILALDDLLELLSEEMGELAKLIAHEQAQEKKTRAQ